jgi:hypothetical protein
MERVANPLGQHEGIGNEEKYQLKTLCMQFFISRAPKIALWLVCYPEAKGGGNVLYSIDL